MPRIQDRTPLISAPAHSIPAASGSSGGPGRRGRNPSSDSRQQSTRSRAPHIGDRRPGRRSQCRRSGEAKSAARPSPRTAAQRPGRRPAAKSSDNSRCRLIRPSRPPNVREPPSLQERGIAGGRDQAFVLHRIGSLGGVFFGRARDQAHNEVDCIPLRASPSPATREWSY